jgi:hypothetical protein
MMAADPVAVNIAPVLITAGVTALGAWLTFRGKTQDTANWLITALRQTAAEARAEAAEARTSADEALEKSRECESHRADDQLVIASMKRRLDELERLASDE